VADLIFSALHHIAPISAPNNIIQKNGDFLANYRSAHFFTGFCLEKINRTLIKKYKPDFDFIFSTRLCLKKNNQTSPKKFQSHFDL